MRQFLPLVLALVIASPAWAAGDAPHIAKQDWSFDGVTGTYDRASLQRGLQVYRQVCSACHGMNRVAYRNLEDLGYTADQVKSLAAEDMVTDGPNDEGEMFDRAARPSDRFKKPYPNDNAGRYANNGALPPDLSLIVKARHGGADYIYGLLTGYAPPPATLAMNPGMHYNKAFSGHQIAMAPPLSDGLVAYGDSSPQTVAQYARDVASFLAWASDPHMEDRKRTGVKIFLFLLALAGVMYFVKKELWKKVKEHQ